MAENLDIFDFTLNEEDMNQIATLDLGKSNIINHHVTEILKYLNGLKIHD